MDHDRRPLPNIAAALYNSSVNTRWRPLLAWLAIQLAVLSIGAIRLPLWARSGRQPQYLALPEVIIADIAIGTLVFPMLKRAGGLSIILVTLPFLQLAGILSATPAAPLIWVEIGVVLWQVGLSLWSAAVRSTHDQMVIVAILSCIVIGGPIASYLVREFGDSSEPVWQMPVICDPITSLVRQGLQSGLSPILLVSPTLLVLAGSVAVAFWKNKSRRAKLST